MEEVRGGEEGKGKGDGGGKERERAKGEGEGRERGASDDCCKNGWWSSLV